MEIKQLTYTPSGKATSNEHHSTMVMMCDEETLKKYRKDNSIPLVDVFDSFEIFKFEKPGKEGKLVHPTKSDLKEVFNSTNDMAIAEFMAKNGEVHGIPHKTHATESGTDLNGMKTQTH